MQTVPITSVDLTMKDAKILLSLMGYSYPEDLLRMARSNQKVTLMNPTQDRPVGLLRYDSKEMAYFVTFGGI